MHYDLFRGVSNNTDRQCLCGANLGYKSYDSWGFY